MIIKPPKPGLGFGIRDFGFWILDFGFGLALAWGVAIKDNFVLLITLIPCTLLVYDVNNSHTM